MVFVAENGSYVVRDDAELSSISLEVGFARRFVTDIRRLREAGHNIGAVWCGRRAAYIERTDAAFVTEVASFYESLEIVDDLLEVPEGALKFAVYDFEDSEASAPVIACLCEPYQVVASTTHWMDIMSPDANKGGAVRSLQAALGIAPEQTAVFGDYLNDLEMLDEADHSFAMANAHPEVIRRARYLAPSNQEHGVLTTVARLLGDQDDALEATPA